MPNVREAKWGERMIEVKVYLWTNEIAKGEGKIRPKHGRGRGMVRVEPNEVHGIGSQRTVPFNSLMELPFAIEKALIRSGITIHPSPNMKKYLV